MPGFGTYSKRTVATELQVYAVYTAAGETDPYTVVLTWAKPSPSDTGHVIVVDKNPSVAVASCPSAAVVVAVVEVVVVVDRTSFVVAEVGSRKYQDCACQQ